MDLLLKHISLFYNEIHQTLFSYLFPPLLASIKKKYLGVNNKRK
jgi:hypothetical protein